MGRSVPIAILTDSHSLFNVMVKSTTTTEKRLMIDIEAAREAYARGEVSNVGWVRSEDNLVDGLTKIKKCDALHELLQTGVLSRKVERWITRPAIINH